MPRHSVLPLAILCSFSTFAAVVQAEPKTIRFDRDIRPLLSDKCFHCHGPAAEDREADLRLDVKEHAFAEREGTPALTAGDPARSSVWLRISSTDEAERMPPAESNKTLTPEQVALIKRWIEEGAEWTEHWAFTAPQKAPLPDVGETTWARNPIDHFIWARAHRAGLQPASEADRRTLIRRLSFDLTGLPPTPAEVEQFVADKGPDAYEKLVDRLLASRHYGERMALMWLDAARYGDTSVYHADGYRDMWAWRDRVVQAYNENLPFDNFSIEQLAGDLLPGGSVAQRVASGFNRNNGTTDEGGAIAEEYRVEYAVDRVKTTSTVWLGLTMECGQCHEHKYDPISQEEYYRFYAFFNVSADKGMQTRRGNEAPTVAVPDPENERKLPGVQKQIQHVQQQMEQHQTASEPAFNKWVAGQEAAARNKKLELLPRDAALHVAFKEGEGNVAADSIDTKRKGRVKGKVNWVTTPFEKGLQLEGNSFVDLGDRGDFERTDSFSYGGWVRTEGPASGAVLARMDNNNAFRGYDLLLSEGAIEVHIIHKWPDNAVKVRTKKQMEPKKWHHVFATYDGSSKAAGVTVYVNGEPWEADVQQNGLRGTIRTKKTLLAGSRHPDSRLKGTVDELRMYRRKLSHAEVQTLANSSPIAPILAVAADQRTAEQTQTLRDYYLHNEDKTYAGFREQLTKLRSQETELQTPLTTVMVMQDAAKPRDTFVLLRGAYDSPTDKKVTAGTPSILPPMVPGAPATRLGLARWLFQPEHPLTARVAVNRYWQMLFGTGLVATPEDFGSQGEYPSHPELLDWLAVDFRDSGWDVKRMLKQIVMSATYRQATATPPEHLRLDPQNRWLARGPRFRLQGEFIRDNALAVSGLLDRKMGGPGVKPYQPPGLWVEVGLSGKPKFVQDHGDKLYRRSLYTYWKRSAPPPNMQIFDAPTREKCTVRRARTNTPLQALVTLNDVQFVEAARAFAQRIVIEGGTTPQQRIAFAYQLALARPPRDSEQQVLQDVFQASLKRYREHPAEAEKLLGFGESKRDASLDAAEHAAWTIIATMMLNLNETLTRG